MKRLTKKQQRFLQIIADYMEKNGYPPTIKELCQILDVSIGTVQQYYFALEKKGVIERANHKGRGLKILVSMPKTEESYIKIPIIDQSLKNLKNIFSRENIVGFFKFPAKLFSKSRIYAIRFKDQFVLFTTGNEYHEGELWLAYSGNEFSVKRIIKDNFEPVGKVLYILQKEKE